MCTDLEIWEAHYQKSESIRAAIWQNLIFTRLQDKLIQESPNISSSSNSMSPLVCLSIASNPQDIANLIVETSENTYVVFSLEPSILAFYFGKHNDPHFNMQKIVDNHDGEKMFVVSLPGFEDPSFDPEIVEKCVLAVLREQAGLDVFEQRLLDSGSNVSPRVALASWSRPALPHMSSSSFEGWSGYMLFYIDPLVLSKL